jgi:hypothetical protein
MDAPVKKPVVEAAKNQAWGVMDGREKTIFVVKVCLMLCSFGFIFGNVLTD